ISYSQEDFRRNFVDVGRELGIDWVGRGTLIFRAARRERLPARKQGIRAQVIPVVEHRAGANVKRTEQEIIKVRFRRSQMQASGVVDSVAGGEAVAEAKQIESASHIR